MPVWINTEACLGYKKKKKRIRSRPCFYSESTIRFVCCMSDSARFWITLQSYWKAILIKRKDIKSSPIGLCEFFYFSKRWVLRFVIYSPLSSPCRRQFDGADAAIRPIDIALALECQNTQTLHVQISSDEEPSSLLLCSLLLSSLLLCSLLLWSLLLCSLLLCSLLLW